MARWHDWLTKEDHGILRAAGGDAKGLSVLNWQILGVVILGILAPLLVLATASILRPGSQEAVTPYLFPFIIAAAVLMFRATRSPVYRSILAAKEERKRSKRN